MPASAVNLGWDILVKASLFRRLYPFHLTPRSGQPNATGLEADLPVSTCSARQSRIFTQRLLAAAVERSRSRQCGQRRLIRIIASAVERTEIKNYSKVCSWPEQIPFAALLCKVSIRVDFCRSNRALLSRFRPIFEMLRIAGPIVECPEGFIA